MEGPSCNQQHQDVGDKSCEPANSTGSRNLAAGSVMVVGRKAGTANDIGSTCATHETVSGCLSERDKALSASTLRFGKSTWRGDGGSCNDSAAAGSCGYNSADEHASGGDWDPAEEVRSCEPQRELASPAAFDILFNNSDGPAPTAVAVARGATAITAIVSGPIRPPTAVDGD